tara:strand:- start:96 stop:209 length:114 start_codon:yes stop_codon:yes gene_type:complete
MKTSKFFWKDNKTGELVALTKEQFTRGIRMLSKQKKK